MLFQEILSRLNDYWSNQGCAVIYPHDSAVGAGTFYPATFFRALNKQPWRVAYLAPTRRPSDGRYGDNPIAFNTICNIKYCSCNLRRQQPRYLFAITLCTRH